jgi:hypothetical protein
MDFTRRQTIFKYTNQASEHSPIVLTDLMPLSLIWSKGIILKGIIQLLPAPPQPGPAQPGPGAGVVGLR